MNLDKLFEERKDDPRWNTSYPLSPEDWKQYREAEPLSFAEEKELSFYIHIPFCKQLCSFCEYTRMVCNDESIQRQYVEGIAHDIERFKNTYKDFTLLGCDIGGGTPTALSEENFEYLISIYGSALANICISKDYEPCIEGTFNTLSEHKINTIVDVGICRLSLGIQSTDSNVLKSYRRENNNLDTIKQWMDYAWSLGVKKINLDLMYGLKGQNKETIAHDLTVISELKPQQVTLYELRTNCIAIKDIPSKNELFCQYEQYYNGLVSLGYYTHFGQNTFSFDKFDMGVSSYLRSRMLDGISYKGFGISAQSMSKKGVSYNVGKSTHNLRQLIGQKTFPEQDTYLLPSSELASKYIAIAAYNGSFSIDRVNKYLQGKDMDSFNVTLAYCLDNNFMKIEKGNRSRITPKGFLHYGAIFSLLMSALH